MQPVSNPSVNSGYQEYPTGPAVPGAVGTMFLNKIPGIPHFPVLNERETLSGLSSGFMLSWMPERTSMSN